MISWDYMQFLNEKVLEYLPVDRVKIGNKVNFRCPLCGDSRKSATKKRGFYYLDTASFFCFNCGTGMSGIKFLQALSGQEYDSIKKEYLKLFARSGASSNLSSFYQQPDAEPGIFGLKRAVKPEWKLPLSADAKKYLDGRRVTSAPFLKEDLYSCAGKTGEYILIPWTINGVEAFYQLNDYKKLGQLKYIFPKNSKKLVYGLDNVDVSWPYIIVFEGVYDSLFVKNAIASGMKSVSDYQRRLIRERYPNHTLCISFDNDRPGLSQICKSISKNEDVLYFKWFGKDTAQKDVNDYVLATGDVNAFTDRAKLQKMIYTPLQMKMWLAQAGKWTESEQIKPVVDRPKRRNELCRLAAKLAE